MNIQQNFSLQPYNTFGIDVQAQNFATITTDTDLFTLLKRRHFEQQNKLILGGGSNLLFTKNVEGWVLYNQLKGIELFDEDNNYAYICVGGGEVWHHLVQYTIDRNWGGLENLSLIPGSVGAAPMQNIGAYGAELKDTFEYLEAIHLPTGERHLFTYRDCKFGYRESIFKNELKNQYFITTVAFRLTKNPTSFNTTYGAINQTLEATNYMNEGKLTLKAVSKAVCHIRQSKLPDPKVLGNCGSFFKNPEINTATFEQLKMQYPNMPNYLQANGNIKIPAAWLIEQCGFKGKQIGNTGTHRNHALVLVNYGNANGAEVWQLAKNIQQSVAERFGVIIQPEVNIL